METRTLRFTGWWGELWEVEEPKTWAVVKEGQGVTGGAGKDAPEGDGRIRN